MLSCGSDSSSDSSRSREGSNSSTTYSFHLPHACVAQDENQRRELEPRAQLAHAMLAAMPAQKRRKKTWGSQPTFSARAAHVSLVHSYGTWVEAARQIVGGARGAQTMISPCCGVETPLQAWRQMVFSRRPGLGMSTSLCRKQVTSVHVGEGYCMVGP